MAGMLCHTNIRFLRLCRVYFQVGEDLPEPHSLPAREASLLLAGRPVAITGSGVEAATVARVGDEVG